MTESRRWCHGNWRHAALGMLSCSLLAATANAACPPAATDGTTITRGELVLAWQPDLPAGNSAKTGRIPMAQHFALNVQLCAKGEISSARLSKADATMPAHKHGMNYRPTISPLGMGRFRVEGMMFHMAGLWELAFEVQTGKEVIRLAHDIQVE